MTAQRYNFPSRVSCSVISASHNRFGPVAVKSRRTRSSCTGGPAFLFLPRFLPNTLHQLLSRQIRHAVRSAMPDPTLRASSARNR
ncbi:hypothetical protein ACFH04_08180 [Streptomyces noboritoensis]|uniref:Integron gene cassette protein n=1 Tax=Streptomyces noboritoensis TaxID=67337 RepID=A0ABV6TD20_9ACTN